jgi:hypothetical protein
VKNDWSYTTVPHICPHVVDMDKIYLNSITEEVAVYGYRKLIL